MLSAFQNFMIQHQQSIGSTGNEVSLSGLIVFTSQFESQGSRLYWKNLYLPI